MENIKHNNNRYIEGIKFQGDYVLINITKNGFPKLLIKSLTNDEEYYYKFEDDMFSYSYPSLYNLNSDENKIRISYSTTVKNPIIYEE